MSGFTLVKIPHCWKPHVVAHIVSPLRPSVCLSFRLFLAQLLPKHIDTGYSSYSFSSIYFRLFRCFCEGLKMCMKFGCNPQIIFVTFFAFFGLASTKGNKYWVSCERNSTYNFSRIFFETLRVFLSRSEDVHDIWLLPSGYISHFFRSLNLIHCFWLRFYQST